MRIKGNVLIRFTSDDVNNECTIPDGVTSIGDFAFSNCKNLKSIHIPDSVTYIGDWAFCGCKNLKSIHIPGGITSIGYGTFKDCKNLESIHIPDGVTYIGYEAFMGCKNLESIHIPDSLTSIKDRTFLGCKKLKSIHIPDSVTYIEYLAFSDCENLKSIRIPDGVTSIGIVAFGGCKNLESIRIPDRVTSIEREAFEYCENLKSIRIPGVTSIGDRAFVGCENLESIHISDGVTSIGDDVFFNCHKLKAIIIKTNGNEDKINRIKALLPGDLRNKVITITKSLYERIIKIQNQQIKRLQDKPEVSGLFEFFYGNNLPLLTPVLPDDMLREITHWEGEDNIYVKTARGLIEELDFPRSADDLDDYKKLIENIVNGVYLTTNIRSAEHSNPTKNTFNFSFFPGKNEKEIDNLPEYTNSKSK